MLQQILKDMYIDPELLEELDEEQKQILFCKLREEQVRRWKENEDNIEAKEKKKPPKPKKPGKKGNIKFLTGSDGNEWVWVMGDHKNDKTIEEIYEAEAHAQAFKLAEQEAEELRKNNEAEIKNNLKEEEERLEKIRKQEEELKRKAEEAAIYQTQKEARLAAEKLEKERKQKEEEEKKTLLRMKEKRDNLRRSSRRSIDEITSKRSSEIYLSVKQAREKFSEKEKVDENEWQEREKRAKESERHKRLIARKAREEHRKSIQTLQTGARVIGKMNNLLRNAKNDNTPPKRPAPPVPKGAKPVRLISRPTRPTGKPAVIKWYIETEFPKGSGLDPGTNQPSEWFHGIITRFQAEDLLEDKLIGSYLVRVSERIWGYAISYKSPDKCKHYLIDATPEGTYQFFGNDQITHQSLADLINFHKAKVISSIGKELLLYPCGQGTGKVDYDELFPEVEISRL